MRLPAMVLRIVRGHRWPAAVVFALGVGLIVAPAFSQSAIPNGAFVRDADGVLWLVLGGQRHHVAVYPAASESLAAIPASGQWVVPSETGAVLGSRPDWAQDSTLAAAAPVPAPPLPAVEPGLRVVKIGYGQTTGALGAVGYGLIVDNTTGKPLYRSLIRLAFFDSAGTMIRTTSPTVELIYPGQRLGLAGTIYVDDGVRVVRVEPSVTLGRAVEAPPFPFSTADVGLRTEFSSTVAAGIVKNASSVEVKDIAVSGIAYDSAGNIIGGGSSSLSFIPANGQAAAKVTLRSSVAPASAELYATYNSYSLSR
ncbi:MAG: hypothetical protein U0821_08915 [Chloroflexota bacterium]